MYIYIIIINIISFVLMGIDKSLSKKKKTRISEFTLFLFALLGGAIGSIIGMKLFHHKTKKLEFKIIMSLMLVINIVCIIMYIK